MRQMNKSVPGIFNQIDGISSHSYPNPAFSQPPSVNTSKSIYSFKYERELVESMSTKKLPVFITETGWISEKITDEMRAEYYKEALSNAWSDSGIVTITPFLLHAAGGPFQTFSFVNSDGTKTRQYESIRKMAKKKGVPTLGKDVLGSIDKEENTELPTKDFRYIENDKSEVSLSLGVRYIFAWMLKI